MNQKDNSKTPLITVLINYYNDKQYLAASIESILNQSFKNFELILFNHASTDGSRAIAHSYNDVRIIHLDGKKNLGAGASHNLHYIFPYIHGTYYKGFSADDIMAKDGLKYFVEYITKNPDKNLIIGNLEYIDNKGKSLKENWFHYIKNFSTTTTEIDLLKMFSEGKNNIPCPAVMIKTNILKTLQLDESMTIRADMWIWLNALINGAKIGFLDKIIAYYRRHKYQESYFDMDVIRRRSEYEKIPLLSLFYNLKDIATVKQVFTNSPYNAQLKDISDIPFYIAEYYLRHYGYPFAYNDLFKMLLDDKTREHLEQTFGFDVLELRKLYAFKQTNLTFKQRINTKQPQKLTILELLYLLTKKLTNKLIALLTLRFLRRKKI